MPTDDSHSSEDVPHNPAFLSEDAADDLDAEVDRGLDDLNAALDDLGDRVDGLDVESY